MTAAARPDVIAAVDLGSNSFHMIVARRDHGDIAILDRLREMVRLGAGLDADGRIDRQSADRAIACLQRFRERLATLEAAQVRAVGTNTLRRARRRDTFLSRAEAALGHPIEVVSGVEEARLVYLGAAHSLPAQAGKRLVVDIGGGSTELIVGDGYEALRLESLYMGCICASTRFFPDGVLTENRFRKARLLARQELEPVRELFRREGWRQAVGTSGTIRATARQLRELGLGSGEITRSGLDALRERLLAAGDIRHHGLPALSAERAPVYPGGLAILTEVFDALSISRMDVAEGALREGLLWDLVGRLTDEDARDRSVRAFQLRFHADTAHAERVEAMALALLAQLAPSWELPLEECRELLSWAARLHEVGLDIAHSHHHRHAAYLLENADLAGFSFAQQQRLAALVGAHRRKMRADAFAAIPQPWRERMPSLVVLLRLAVLLNRSRSIEPPPVPTARDGHHKLTLEFPPGWLDARPLTRADLVQEARYLSAVDLKLTFR